MADLMTAKTVRRERWRESRGMMTADELATERYSVLTERLDAIKDKHLGMTEHQNEQIKSLVSLLIKDLRIQRGATPEAPTAPVRHLHAVK